MKKKLISAFLHVVYFLKLRGPFARLQRWYTGENNARRSPLPIFSTPQNVESYVNSKFMYRLDTGNFFGVKFPLDWPTDPEVFQARLDAEDGKDGDCDDYHTWAAHALSLVSGVESVFILSCIYEGGGHTVCVFKYLGDWFLFNYRIILIESPNKAPEMVAKWANRKDGTLQAYVFENLEPAWTAAAIGPNGKIPE